ncbi:MULTISPECIES: anti-repressor SinI family protein [unclassified Sutcliffiella]
MNDSLKKYQLDKEWVSLIMEAKKLGLGIEEVRTFIQSFIKTD